MTRTSELRAVITGASSGIGGAIATAIASTGASVCLIGRDPGRLKEIAAIAQTTARMVLLHEADLTRDRAIPDLVQRIQSKFGALDVLVHCAIVDPLKLNFTPPAANNSRKKHSAMAMPRLTPGSF
jgi:NADP-dependent 3-hydroxy acid dehydrogenase YdfG